MTGDLDALGKVERILENVPVGVERSGVRGGLLFRLAAVAAGLNVLTVRIMADLILLDVDSSDAIELTAGDDQELADLATVVDAFSLGSLEVLVGERSGRTFAIRAGGLVLDISTPLRSSFGAGRKVWKALNG